MKYADLNARQKEIARNWARDAVNEFYEKQGIPSITENSAEVRLITGTGDYTVIKENGQEQVVRVRRY